MILKNRHICVCFKTIAVKSYVENIQFYIVTYFFIISAMY